MVKAWKKVSETTEMSLKALKAKLKPWLNSAIMPKRT